MKSEMPKKRKRKKKRNREWIPRVPFLFPPGKAMKSKRDYDRKLEKSISFWR